MIHLGHDPRVLVVMPSGQPRGGAEEALLQFCGEAAAGSGPPVSVVVLEPGELAEQLRSRGAEVTEVNAKRLRDAVQFVAAVRAIRRQVQRSASDVVVGWMGKAHLYACPATLGTRARVAWFQMGLPDDGRVSRIAQALHADAVLACSAFVADEQRRAVRGRVPVHAVALGADLTRFDPNRLPFPAEARRACGLPADGLMIGIVGRLQRWKGMHVLVEAMPSVLARHPTVRGVIVGGPHDLEPAYETDLRGLIADCGLADRIVMAGLQRDVPLWMQAMDVIIHASEREPFGIVVVEAMALGKPVVAAVPGGPAEIVRDGIDGLLVPSGRPDALAAAIVRYLDDLAFAAACGAAARERALIFSAEGYARRLRGTLADIVCGSACRTEEVVPS